MNKETIIVLTAGIFIGLAAVVLVLLGSPGNMGFCIACFERDIVGALGFCDFRDTVWIRPEIIGIVLGAFIAAFLGKEFQAQGGSSPMIRFFMGMFVMIGALTFLGCPLRMILRLGGGDLNALVALVGFFAGIMVGVSFLKSGFNLGRTQRQRGAESFVFLAIVAALLGFLLFLPVFKTSGPIFVAEFGHPGSSQSPISRAAGTAVSLGIGVLAGVLAQRSRLCLAGGLRDFVLIRSTYLLKGFFAILIVTAAGNIILGKFHLGFENQPVAHTDYLWNFLGMSLVGLGSVFLGGCPLRQLVLTGSGNADSALSVFGMFAGAAISHNFGLIKASSVYGKTAVILGILICIVIGLVNREK